MRARAVHTLSSRLLRITLLGALLLGLLVSLIQTLSDYDRVRHQPEADMEALVSIVRAPAAAVVFSLDDARADELLEGMLSQPAVTGARLLLENGRVFAERHRPLAHPDRRGFNDRLFGRTRAYSWPLKPPLDIGLEQVGTLEIELDTHVYGKVFFERLMINMTASLIYALVLTALSLLIFYVLVTRPLTSVIRSIESAGDTPEKARLNEPPGHANSEIGMLVRLTNQHLDAMDGMLAQLRNAESRLKRYSDELEEKVSERTQALSASLLELESAKGQLIQSEKMAALGGLVAGIAHEVNTPLGIAVTASSVLTETLDELHRKFDEKSLTSADFERLVGHAIEGNTMLINNINRAARLISDFKKTAVDQISETRCEFEVRSTLMALIASLHPETRRVPVVPRLECPEGIEMRSLPGVLTQVVSNLIINSVRHAFSGIEKPEIVIEVMEDGDWIALEYRDNGTGVPEALHQRIFEPFYTSKRGQGGSGLGLNIVFNLINRKLKGQLHFESAPGQGVHFSLRIPRLLDDGKPVPVSG